MAYDTVHTCPCGFQHAIVRHDQQVVNVPWVESKYAAHVDAITSGRPWQPIE